MYIHLHSVDSRFLFVRYMRIPTARRILMAEKEESKRKMEQDVICKIDEIKQNIPQDNSSMKTYVKNDFSKVNIYEFTHHFKNIEVGYNPTPA